MCCVLCAVCCVLCAVCALRRRLLRRSLATTASGGLYLLGSEYATKPCEAALLRGLKKRSHCKAPAEATSGEAQRNPDHLPSLYLCNIRCSSFIFIFASSEPSFASSLIKRSHSISRVVLVFSIIISII